MTKRNYDTANRLSIRPNRLLRRTGALKSFGAVRSGFTLLEILVALTILGLVFATVIGTFTGIISSSRKAEKRAELQQTGRAVLDLISADIRGIFKNPASNQGIFFVGDLETVEDKSMSKMDFLTTNSLSIGRQKNPFLSEVGYRIKKNPKGQLFSLWRRSQSPPEIPFDKGGREVPVCLIIKNFQLEFTQNNAKKENLLNIFPSSIVIHLSLNLDGEKDNFMTMVRPMINN